jgi:hypothetical protein
MVIFVVPPNAMVQEHLSSIAAPMVGKKGKDWTGRLVLVDHLRRKHKTDKITFMWVVKGKKARLWAGSGRPIPTGGSGEDAGTGARGCLH